MTQVLKGIRVLDFGRYISGPYCASLLGDFGAEVIRIERVGGGEDRFVVPLAAVEGGASFLQTNRNKKSLTIELSNPKSRELLNRLIATADVVVVNLPPQVLPGLGLDYASVKAVRHDIILTTINGKSSMRAWRQRLAGEALE